jgi:CD2 antigen cytoplasmic tail-binding protein 2
MSSSRYAAARPKRAGEEFARTHHLDSDGPSKRARFDVRNPSALAADEREEDAVLDADVIGGGGAGIKRGAINVDGYDSDSDNEGFDGRAEERGKGKKGDVNLFDQLENYGKDGGSKNGANTAGDTDDDADMFADLEEEFEDGDEGKGQAKSNKKDKNVTFLDDGEIEGQVASSKSGGHVSSNFALDPNGKLSSYAMDDQESSDDEDDAILAAQEEDIDEEVGAGGLKRNAPKIDAFNLRRENEEEGRFDQAGNFIRKAADRDAVHDTWMEGISKKDMKKAAEAHERREAERRQKRLEDDAMLISDILSKLILRLEKGESVLEALARLGKGQTKAKKIPKWKLKKQKQNTDGMDVDEEKAAEDPAQVKIREAVDDITGAADQLLTRGQTDIYEQEREMLIRQYRKETGEDWVEPAVEEDTDGDGLAKMWEYRWTDGRDDAKQGPYDGATMAAWEAAGYFGEGIEFRRAGDVGGWTRVIGSFI